MLFVVVNGNKQLVIMCLLIIIFPNVYVIAGPCDGGIMSSEGSGRYLIEMLSSING